MQLSSNKDDLKAALAETQMLRVTDMSTALLTVFIDSAKALPVSFNFKSYYLTELIIGIFGFIASKTTIKTRSLFGAVCW